MEHAQSRGLIGPSNPGVLCKPNKQAYELVMDIIGAKVI